MTSKVIAYTAVAVLVAAGLGAGMTYAVQKRRIDALEIRMERLNTERQELKDSLDAAEASLAATPAQPGAAPEVPQPLEQPQKIKTREFAFVKKVTAKAYDPKQRGGVQSVGSVVADYAQFLTGKAAADAAKAAGDESPPPNDFYIVNANPQLRTLVVLPGVKVRLTTNPDGTADPAGYTSDFETWANFFAAPSEENAPMRAAGYWLTLEDGQIVAIEEQFVP